MIKKIEIERFSVTSAKPFEEVLAAINDAVGHPEMAQFWESTHRARTARRAGKHDTEGIGKIGTHVICAV